MDLPQLLSLYGHMLTARELDRLEAELTSRGEAFFHVSGAGHEAAVALLPHLTAGDWLHCHYRDKALMLGRGIGVEQFFSALYCKHNSHSRGRQMNAHMAAPELNVLSIVGPVGNSALQAVGVAAAIKDRDGAPFVLCSLGEGTTQEGEFLEAVAEAVRHELPVMFFIEDNHWAISTQTRGNTFYSQPRGDVNEFYGLAVQRIDGRDVVTAAAELGKTIDEIRRHRGPAIVVMDVERLASHTNADDQTIYREEADIRQSVETGDPIRHLEDYLLEQGVSREELNAMREEVVRDVARAEAAAAAGPDPEPAYDAKRELPDQLTNPVVEIRGDSGEPGDEMLTMKDAIRDVLRNHLLNDERVTLYGQDIADPKGDVFGVTRGLSSEFGARVCNAPLSEATIVGVSIGKALAGQRPVCFLQFADFLPLAYNQIVSELGSMHWRTDGAYSAPVIIMVPCGAFRPGLGPFHAQSLESIAAHTPGIDVFMPSTASDAAGLLNAAFKSERPTVFYYPKAALNDPSHATSPDVNLQLVPVGPARLVQAGRDISLVTWGNTVNHCRQAADALMTCGIEAEVIELRSLSPWDQQAVIRSAEKTGRMIVVHEDNQTCGFGAEVLATVTERASGPVVCRRIARPDTFVPCNFANQIEVLPSFKRILSCAADMLDLQLSWIPPRQAEAGMATIEAVGSGPSDESVTVLELFVSEGQRIERGDVVASLEATKSVFELTSQVSGVVQKILVAEGDQVAVGATLMELAVQSRQRAKPVTQERSGTPVLVRKQPHNKRDDRPDETSRSGRSVRQNLFVGMSTVNAVTGARQVSNVELCRNGDGSDPVYGPNGMTPDDIVRLTGIASRQWVDSGEDAVSLAVQAAGGLLAQLGLSHADLDLLICATTSPSGITPSMACTILGRLAGNADTLMQAYDINAACSGYLYALQAGYDYLQMQPDARVLIVTTEVLSPLLDRDDFDTAILFGDAASATLLYGAGHRDAAVLELTRPELSGKGDDGNHLSVPLLNDGFIKMKGRKVFTEAVRTMISSLARVCQREAIDMNDLSLVVPHQANQRIMDAIQHRTGLEVYSNIANHGNTSSTSIPLCLTELIPQLQAGQRIGLCAFGGGFTFGAGVVEKL